MFGGYPSFREVPRLARFGKLARLGGPVSCGRGASGRSSGRLANPPSWRPGVVIAESRERVRSVPRHLHLRRGARARGTLRRARCRCRRRRDRRARPTHRHGQRQPPRAHALHAQPAAARQRRDEHGVGRGAARAVHRFRLVRDTRAPAGGATVAAAERAAAAGRSGTARVGDESPEARIHVADRALARTRMGRHAADDRTRRPPFAWIPGIASGPCSRSSTGCIGSRPNMSDTSADVRNAGHRLCRDVGGLLLALAFFPADPSPPGALAIPATILAAGILFVPVLRAIRRSPRLLLRGEPGGVRATSSGCCST